MKKKDIGRVKIARSKSGNGLYACVPFKKGECIIEYTGTKISTAVADALTTRYLFEIDEDWTIDGSTRSNTARYINHSCKPNSEADIQNGHILIMALRKISVGEEITFDYGDEYFDEFIRPYGCRCLKCMHSTSSSRASDKKPGS